MVWSTGGRKGFGAGISMCPVHWLLSSLPLLELLSPHCSRNTKENNSHHSVNLILLLLLPQAFAFSTVSLTLEEKAAWGPPSPLDTTAPTSVSGADVMALPGGLATTLTEANQSHSFSKYLLSFSYGLQILKTKAHKKTEKQSSLVA